jgi:hypothetical protein
MLLFSAFCTHEQNEQDRKCHCVLVCLQNKCAVMPFRMRVNMKRSEEQSRFAGVVRGGLPVPLRRGWTVQECSAEEEYDDLHLRLLKVFPGVCALTRRVVKIGSRKSGRASGLVELEVKRAGQRLTEDQRLELEVVFNDIHAHHSTSTKPSDASHVRKWSVVNIASADLKAVVASPRLHHLCARHCTQVFLEINGDGHFVSAQDCIPSAEYPRMSDELRLLQEHGATLLGHPPLRLYQYTSGVIDVIATESLTMPRAAAVHEALRSARVSPTRPLCIGVVCREIGTVAHLLQLRARRDADSHRYVSEMKNHTHCYFCFPTLLSIVAHAWQQRYTCTRVNIPTQMARVVQLNPALQARNAFASAVAHVESKLLAARPSVEHNDDTVSRVRSNYNDLVAAVWEETRDVVAFDAAMVNAFVHAPCSDKMLQG